MVRRTAQASIQRQRLRAGEVADQWARHELNHAGQGRALVAAKGLHCAALQNRDRVGAGLAIFIQTPARWQGAATAPVQLDLATRYGAGGKVKYIGVRARARPAEGQRVGAKHRAAPARRRHAGVGGRHGQRAQAVFSELLDFGPERRKMEAVVDDQRAHAAGTDFFHQVAAADLKSQGRESRLRIHRDHNRRTLGDHGFGVAADAAVAQRLHTHQQAEQAVGMAGIALPGNHDAGHGLGVWFGHAVVAQHVQRQGVQLRQREGDGVGVDVFGGGGVAHGGGGYRRMPQQKGSCGSSTRCDSALT